jgi:hypothetical protein
MLRRDGFASKSSSADSINSSEPAGKSRRRPMSSAIFTRKEGTLQQLFSIYPKAEATFRGFISAANFNKGIKGTDFQSKKERMLILYYFLESYKGLKENQSQSLVDAVLDGKDKQKVLDLLKSFTKDEKSSRSSVKWDRRSSKPQEETMWIKAHNYATTVSDSLFLSQAKTLPVGDSQLSHDIAVECEEAAYNYLKTQLDYLTSGISQQILSIQKDECDAQVQREVKSEEEKELKLSRAEFVRQIEELCRERSRS